MPRSRVEARLRRDVAVSVFRMFSSSLPTPLEKTASSRASA
jgi:hypothetical protein